MSKAIPTEACEAIAHQCIQAFNQASANTASAQIPPELLAALIRHEIWTPEEGLQRVEHAQVAHQRVNLLLAIIPLLSSEQLPRAVAIARGFRNSSQRILALGALLERMPELWDELCQAKPGPGERRFYNQLWRLPTYLPDRFVPQMMVLAGEFHCSKDRNYFWQQLLTRLDEPLLSDYLARVRQEEDVAARSRLLSAIAQTLPAVWPEALKSLAAISDVHVRYSVLHEIAPTLPEAFTERALKIAERIIAEGFERVEGLVALIPRLSEEQLPKATAIARNLSSTVSQAEVLGAIASRQPDLWPEVWSLIEPIEESPRFSRVLNRIAEQLPDAYFSKMLEAVTRVEYPFNRFEILTQLVPNHPELWPQILAIPPQLDMEYLRSDALVKLAQLVPDSMLGEILQMTEILQFDQLKLIDRLAPRFRLPKPLLREALAMTKPFRDEDVLVVALAALAKYQPELWPKVWKACASIEKESIRATAIQQILPYLPDTQIPQCLELSKTLEDDCRQLQVLCELVPRRPELLDEVLEQIRAMPMVPQGNFLCRLATYRPALWDEVIEVAKNITTDFQQRFRILTRAAPHRPELWPWILQVFQLTSLPDRIKLSCLRELAPQLPQEFLPEVIEIAMSIPNPDVRLAAICLLARREPKLAIETIESLSVQALRTSQKTNVLQCLTPVLPEEQLATAFRLYQSIEPTEIYERFSALCDLAQRQPDLWSEALAIARQQLASHSTYYDSMLGRLAKDLPDRWIPTLQELIESIQEPVPKASTFSSLLPRLELAEIGTEEFESLMEILAGGERKTYLKSIPLLTPAILKLGGASTLEAISARLYSCSETD